VYVKTANGPSQVLCRSPIIDSGFARRAESSGVLFAVRLISTLNAVSPKNSPFKDYCNLLKRILILLSVLHVRLVRSVNSYYTT
jgi:hypothetical protein